MRLPREDAANLAADGCPARDTTSTRRCSPVTVSPALAEAPPPREHVADACRRRPRSPPHERSFMRSPALSGERLYLPGVPAWRFPRPRRILAGAPHLHCLTMWRRDWAPRSPHVEAAHYDEG
jgi:hypothetical protein